MLPHYYSAIYLYACISLLWISIFQHLLEVWKASFSTAKKALQERFEPKSRQSPYQAEFQTCTKCKSETWADFADDLKNLTDKAYLELEEAARERLAVNQYLQQLEHPQVAFIVKQKQPAKLDEVVSTTLEMEAYSMKPDHMVASVQGEDEAEGESTVAVVGRVIHWLLLWRDLWQGWRD